MNTKAFPASAMALTILMLFASACAPRNPGLVPVQTVLQGRIDVLPPLTSTVSDGRVRLLLSQPLDADDAVEIALLNNADLQAEFEGLNIAYAALRDASLLPNLELETDVASIQGSSENEFGFALTANLSQLFLTSMRRDVARYELDATQYETALTVLALSETVRRAFYGYQSAEQILELAQTVLDAAGASYEVAERLNEAGNITALELATQQAFYEEARSESSLAQADVIGRRESLNVLMGTSGADVDWTAIPRLEDPEGDVPDLDALEARAIDQSLDLTVLDTRYSAAAQRASLARIEGFLPSLRAGVHTDHEGGNRELGPVISVEIPLFNRGQAVVAGARAEMRRLEQQYRAREVEIRAAARATGGQVAIAAERARHYRDVLLPLQEQIIQQTQLQYNAMQLGVFQLITARREQVRTAEGYVMALRDYWNVRTSLDQVLAGRLTQFDDSIGPRWARRE